jgi:hypothetical protein
MCEMSFEIGNGPLRADRERQQELRERAILESRRASVPLEVAAIVGVAFAVPAMAAWGLPGLALAAVLGGAMWLFERGRRRAVQRESLAQLWRSIEDACCIDDVRDAARRALAELEPPARSAGR